MGVLRGEHVLWRRESLAGLVSGRDKFKRVPVGLKSKNLISA